MTSAGVQSSGKVYCRSSFQGVVGTSQTQEAVYCELCVCILYTLCCEVWKVSVVHVVCGEGQWPVRTGSAPSNRMPNL